MGCAMKLMNNLLGLTRTLQINSNRPKLKYTSLSHHIPAFRSYATTFPIIKDPKALKLSFKQKIDATAWRLDTPFDPEEKKEIVNEVLDLNPRGSLSEHFCKKPWSIDSFNDKHVPTVLGSLKEKEPFSAREADRYLLFMDMPIKLAGKGWQIPIELAQYREVIEKSARFERLINPNYPDYNVYLTIDQRPVMPGESQRRTGWHGDSYINIETRIEALHNKIMIETDSIYLVSDCIPTQFCAGPFPFKSLDPNETEQVLHHFETTAKDKEVITYPPYTLVRMGPECIHRVGLNLLNTITLRTFLKITFSRQILNREGNGLNPLFDVNWPMYPRSAEKRNHSNVITGYHTDAEKYRLVNHVELSEAFEGIRSQAVKTAHVTGYLATPGELLQTVYDNFVTTVNIAKPGDWKITSPCGDQYFLPTEKLEKLYDPLSNGMFAPKPNRVSFIMVREPIKTMAPWGSLQYLRPGDYLVKRNEEIYGILENDFQNNYTKLVG